MSTIIHPVHVGMIKGHPVRFFRSLMPVPDFPWHSLTQLMAATGHTAEQTQYMLQATRNGAFASDTRRIATDSGVTVIAPHFMAQGMIGAMFDAGRTPASTMEEYLAALAQAVEAILGALPAQAGIEMLAAMALAPEAAT